ICEWLPISSTGHLILLGELISLDISADPEINSQFSAMFDVVIQLGAILAVVILYFNKLNPFKRENLPLWKKLILATLPAAIIGFGADILCEKRFGIDLDTLLFTPHIVATALIIYGIIFILVELLGKKEKDGITVTNTSSLAIGFFQALAIIPGTSRSGATILGARILGLDKKSAAEFSFFAAVPAILGASALKIFEFTDFVVTKNLTLTKSAYALLAVAFFTALLISLISIKLLLGFIRRHSFIPFGIYRILLGIAVLLIL
ncbi:MAG: undecaprenyl-diphosphate phosphatase, partial [Clostridia bacterium]|nr:undecaprenyl-diphosphate phosphatase [Clostridia bacterium]